MNKQLLHPQLQRHATHAPTLQHRVAAAVLCVGPRYTHLARHRLLATAADVEAALATADPPAAAPAAAAAPAPAAAAEAEGSGNSSSTSSSTPAASPSIEVVRIGANSDSTRTARFLSAALMEAPGGTCRMQAAGQLAALQAFKTLAKADEMLSEGEPRQRITFLVNQRFDGGVAVVEFIVCAQRADALSTEQSADNHPMRIAADTAAEKIAAHAVYSANQRISLRTPAAFWRVKGYQLPKQVKLLLKGFTNARRQLIDDGKDSLMFTISKTLYEVDIKEQPQQKQEQEAAAERTEEGSGASDATSGSSSSSRKLIKSDFLITGYRCQGPLRRHAAAGKADRDSRRAGSAAGVQTPRPGFVEVPAEEFAQLKEQLEVVPHLTEQLQIMTRQHEQLLSLLAAQGDAQPAATAEGQQQ